MGTVRLSPPLHSTLVIFLPPLLSSPGAKNAEKGEKESFVQAKTSVTRKNICVVIYQLGRSCRGEISND